MISAGDAAPDFTLPVTGGGTLTLAALRPARVVLFFYPKDLTPACTTEAVDFSALAAAFTAAGARLVGISRDSLKRHANFTAKHGLDVPLASDADGAVCAAWGVWGEKKLYGKVPYGHHPLDLPDWPHRPRGTGVEPGARPRPCRRSAGGGGGHRMTPPRAARAPSGPKAPAHPHPCFANIPAGGSRSRPPRDPDHAARLPLPSGERAGVRGKRPAGTGRQR